MIFSIERRGKRKRRGQKKRLEGTKKGGDRFTVPLQMRRGGTPEIFFRKREEERRPSSRAPSEGRKERDRKNKKKKAYLAFSGGEATTPLSGKGKEEKEHKRLVTCR